MKMKWIKNLQCMALLMALGTLAPVTDAAEPTAFELIKEGNRYVGEEAKDKVVQIRSEKSVAGLTPNIWFIVYYDVDARMKATEVKFGAGKKMDVQRPLRLIERADGNYKNIMDHAKLKVDSEEALKIATKEKLLEKVKLTNSKLTLQKSDEGAAVWEIVLWAEKLRDASKTTDIGKIFINAEDGKVTRLDLHIDRID